MHTGPSMTLAAPVLILGVLIAVALVIAVAMLVRGRRGPEED